MCEASRIERSESYRKKEKACATFGGILWFYMMMSALQSSPPSDIGFLIMLVAFVAINVIALFAFIYCSIVVIGELWLWFCRRKPSDVVIDV